MAAIKTDHFADEFSPSCLFLRFAYSLADYRDFKTRSHNKVDILMRKFYRFIFENKILLLCTLSTLIILCLLLGGMMFNEYLYQNEKALVMAEASTTAEAFEQYTVQVINQVDVLLNAVRSFYRRTGSLSEAHQFIDTLNFDKSSVENIYLISADGTIVISHEENTINTNVQDREYFRYHQSTPADTLFISPIELGRNNGQFIFPITRRIDNPDHSFGGIILVTLRPQSFTRYYNQLKIGTQNVASLVGILDRKVRVRIPETNTANWTQPFESPLWAALKLSPAGNYENQSPVDGVIRTIVYKKVDKLPLAIVIGFSDIDIGNRIAERQKWLVLAEGVLIFFVLIITAILIGMIINRDKLSVANQSLNTLNARLQELALSDALTGLPSRVLFSDRFQVALLSAQRNNERCFLMFIDLDDFKEVNDNFGHAAGDEVLKTMSARMSQILRSSDTLCRWGGDEFLLLQTHPRTTVEVIEIAERLLAVINDPVDFNGTACQVSASIGIASFPENGQTLTDLQTAADAAMYLAKQRGKNQVV